MALLEKEMLRFAGELEGQDHVSLSDLGGTDEAGYWLIVRDRRFDLQYGIRSHCDYWDFVEALVNHRKCLVLPVRREAA